SKVAEKFDVNIMFQGCEHINRAVTMDRSVAKKRGYEIVNVVPHREAGGSLSEHAYKHLGDPAVVEHVTADRGIDIGLTIIGMRVCHVAVPVRTEQKTGGSVNVTIAFSRPKLIGDQEPAINNKFQVQGERICHISSHRTQNFLKQWKQSLIVRTIILN